MKLLKGFSAYTNSEFIIIITEVTEYQINIRAILLYFNSIFSYYINTFYLHETWGFFCPAKFRINVKYLLCHLKDILAFPIIDHLVSSYSQQASTFQNRCHLGSHMRWGPERLAAEKYKFNLFVKQIFDVLQIEECLNWLLQFLLNRNPSVVLDILHVDTGSNFICFFIKVYSQS